MSENTKEVHIIKNPDYSQEIPYLACLIDNSLDIFFDHIRRNTEGMTEKQKRQYMTMTIKTVYDNLNTPKKNKQLIERYLTDLPNWIIAKAVDNGILPSTDDPIIIRW